MIVVASQRASSLDPDSERRVRETFATFADRFPESQLLMQTDAPQTEDEVRAWLEEFAPPIDHGPDVHEGILQGEVTAMLAAHHGKPLAEVWPALFVLPLGFSATALDELELQNRGGSGPTYAGAM